MRRRACRHAIELVLLISEKKSTKAMRQRFPHSRARAAAGARSRAKTAASPARRSMPSTVGLERLPAVERAEDVAPLPIFVKALDDDR